MKIRSWSKLHTFQSALRMLSAKHLNIDGPPFPIKFVRIFGSALGGEVTYKGVCVRTRACTRARARTHTHIFYMAVTLFS